MFYTNKEFFLSTAWLVLLLVGCQEVIDELSEMEPIPERTILSVEDAKSWFENDFFPLAICSEKILSEDSYWVDYRKLPDWDKAETSHSSTEAVVEIPIIFIGNRPNFALEEENENSIAIFRLVITMDVLGEMDARLMTIMADLAYAKHGKTQLSDNTYLTKTNDFSGRVLFHDWCGKFLGGEVYQEGTKVAEIE